MPAKLNENTEVALPLRNIISMVAAASLATWAYFGLIERLNTLETNQTMMQADLAQMATGSGRGSGKGSPCLRVKLFAPEGQAYRVAGAGQHEGCCHLRRHRMLLRGQRVARPQRLARRAGSCREQDIWARRRPQPVREAEDEDGVGYLEKAIAAAQAFTAPPLLPARPRLRPLRVVASAGPPPYEEAKKAKAAASADPFDRLPTPKERARG